MEAKEFKIGTIVRLTPNVEMEKPFHNGKHFTVVGHAGRFLQIEWQRTKYFYLPEEVIIIKPQEG